MTDQGSAAFGRASREPDAASSDPLEGLPTDLAALLRDPRIIVPQDAAVFELVAKWADAPSDTASAMSVDEWRQAWSVTCRRMLDAQAERDGLYDAVTAQLEHERDAAEHPDTREAVDRIWQAVIEWRCGVYGA